jgi:hypothetical protein
MKGFIQCGFLFIACAGTFIVQAQSASTAYFVDEGFLAGPSTSNAGFTLSVGGTYTGGGNFGRNSPSIQLSSSTDYIQYGPWAGSADHISFLYKGQSATPGTISVQESSNGTTWTTVSGSPVTPITTGATFDASLLSTSRYIKISYTKTANNTMLDDLRIRKANKFSGSNHINILEELINGGCGTCEGYNEFVYFETGDSSLDIHYLEIVNPTMTYGAGNLAFGGDGTTGTGNNNNTNVNWILNGSLSSAQTNYTGGLNTTAGCALFVNIPASNIIPQYSKVIAFTGCCPDASYNFSGMCSSIGTYGQVYVIYADESSGCSGSGKYGNSCASNCTRFLTLFNHKTGDLSNKSFTAPASTGNGGAWDFVSNSATATGCNTFIVLPVRLTAFKAEEKNSSAQIDFTTATEENVKQFILSRSYDAVDYVPFASVRATNTRENHNYQVTDNELNRTSGIVYYRLEEEDINGITKELGVYSLPLGTSPDGTIVSGTASGIFLRTANPVKLIELYSPEGKRVFSEEIDNVPVSASIDMEFAGRGVYFLKITDPNNSSVIRKVVR